MVSMVSMVSYALPVARHEISEEVNSLREYDLARA